MRRAKPDDRMSERPFSSIIGRLDAGNSDERLEGRIQRDQAAAGFGGVVVWTSQALIQPEADMSLSGRKLGQERLIGQGAIPHVRP